MNAVRVISFVSASSLALASFVCSIGCKHADETITQEESKTSSSKNEGDGGGVTPIMPSAGANAPMANTDSVAGAGSGVGQVAKDRARSAAAKSSVSSGQGATGD